MLRVLLSKNKNKNLSENLNLMETLFKTNKINNQQIQNKKV